MTETPLTAEDVLAALGEFGPVEAVRKNRIRVTVPRDRVREAIARAFERLRCDHLIQIASVDTGKAFELHYHLTGPHRTVVTVRAELQATMARAASAHIGGMTGT